MATSNAYVEKPDATPVAIEANGDAGLAPCPFCGLVGLEAEQPWPEQHDWCVTCSSCGCTGPPAETAPKAVSLWNKRMKTDGYVLSALD